MPRVPAYLPQRAADSESMSGGPNEATRMASTHDETSKATAEARTDPPKALPADGPPKPATARPPSHRWRKRLLWVGLAVGLGVGGFYLKPAVETALNTVSTDDAYVNGHVTFVAPRVSGQVSRVLVDDNYRVKKGALLVQLDKEPFEDQVDGQTGRRGGGRGGPGGCPGPGCADWRPRSGPIGSSSSAPSRTCTPRSPICGPTSRPSRAGRRPWSWRGTTSSGARSSCRAEASARKTSTSGARRSRSMRRRSIKPCKPSMRRESAWGSPPQPPKGHDLGEVPDDLDQNFSAVRQALGQLIAASAQLGYTPPSWDATPKQALEVFLKQDPEGNLDHIYATLIPQAPAIKQAEAKLQQARRDLELAELDLRYCDVASEIDGVVTRRNVNPGNNVQAGQSLMAVRSLTEIWIDANFKETQLADLRIGHRVRCEVDMYGSRREYEGRITGFTMGTGQTLALLPPQNATGNFVKIVQRLPVRVELTDYDPDKAPLFVGLSVVPYVYYKERPAGPHAGEMLATAPRTSTRTRRVDLRGSLAIECPRSQRPQRPLNENG